VSPYQHYCDAAVIVYQNELMFINRPAWQIQNAGADQSVAGNNQNWYGSTRHLMISSLKRLRLHWLAHRRQ
jgi:hypothetical protein